MKYPTRIYYTEADKSSTQDRLQVQYFELRGSTPDNHPTNNGPSSAQSNAESN